MSVRLSRPEVHSATLFLSMHEARIVGASLLAGAFILYLVTLAPTFTWGDGADLPLRVFDRDDHSSDLTVRSYQLYRAIGRVFLLLPFGDIAYRINLMTALFGALTVGCLYGIVLRRTQSVAAAAAGAAALATSHTFWLLSVSAEVYTLATLMASLVLLGALAWQQTRRPVWILVAALAQGLGLSHHLSALLYLPSLAWFAWTERRHLRARPLALAGAVFIVGLLPLTQQLIHVLRDAGGEGIRSYLGGPTALSPRILIRDGVTAIAYLIYQFPGPALALGLLGVVTMARRREPWDVLTIGTFMLMTLWAVANRIPDKHNSYVLTYPLFAVFVGIGSVPALGALAPRLRRSGRTLTLAYVSALSLGCISYATYTFTPLLVKRMHLDLVRARPCPNRDNDWYFLYPPKNGYDGARRYASAALAVVESSALIVADYTLWQPLLFMQRVEGVRPDVTLEFVEPLLPGEGIVSFLKAQVAQRPTYLATNAPEDYYKLSLVSRHFLLEPKTPVFRVRAR